MEPNKWPIWKYYIGGNTNRDYERDINKYLFKNLTGMIYLNVKKFENLFRTVLKDMFFHAF